MRIFVLLDSKTDHIGFLLLVSGWKPSLVRGPAGNQAALLSARSCQTAKGTTLFHVCPLLADVRIAGLSPSLLQEHLQCE